MENKRNSDGIAEKFTRNSKQIKLTFVVSDCSLENQNKKKSKISLKLENIRNTYEDEYDDIYQNDIDEEFNIEDGLGPNVEIYLPHLANLDIIVNIVLLMSGNEQIVSLPLTLPENSKISEVITKSIEIFNKKEYQIKVNKKTFMVQLNPSCLSYPVKKSKKNNKPNDDYPTFSNNTFINQTFATKFCLMIDKKEMILIDNNQNKCFII